MRRVEREHVSCVMERTEGSMNMLAIREQHCFVEVNYSLVDDYARYLFTLRQLRYVFGRDYA